MTENYDYYRQEYERKWNDLYKVVSECISDCLDHLSEGRKNEQISKLTRSFFRAKLYTVEDIRNIEEFNGYHRGLNNSRYANIVLDKLHGVYDERKEKEKRLARIEMEIARLNDERSKILTFLEQA